MDSVVVYFWDEFTLSLGYYVDFTLELLYNSTPHSPEGIIHLRTVLVCYRNEEKE